jgi:Methylase involved in ubiquinone/menaquinone biosynthesis
LSNLYENKELRAVCGATLRPGGLAVTDEGLELCAFPRGSILIDLGCGPGGTLKHLRGKGFKAIGVDRSSPFLAEAEAFGQIVAADFHHLPFEDNFADGMLCECALSLAEDKPRVLAECFRVLKAGGRLIVSDIFRINETGRTTPLPADQANGSCLCGAVDLATMRKLFVDRGFEVEHYRDHRQALKELAARLVWHFGSIAPLKELTGGSGTCGGRDFGYALFIARAKPDDERITHD